VEMSNLPVPDFQTLMRPLLEFASDGKEHSLAEAREKLAQVFKLSDEEKKALLPSGRQPRFTNRVAWARVYLGQAGALDSPKRGYFRITDRGLTFLGEAPERVTVKDLEQFPEFYKLRSATKVHKEEPVGAEENGQTPEEMLESAYQKFRDGIASELLASRRYSVRCDPRGGFGLWTNRVGASRIPLLHPTLRVRRLESTSRTQPRKNTSGSANWSLSTNNSTVAQITTTSPRIARAKIRERGKTLTIYTLGIALVRWPHPRGLPTASEALEGTGGTGGHFRVRGVPSRGSLAACFLRLHQRRIDGASTGGDRHCPLPRPQLIFLD
jgi:hypothetical protein